MSAINEKLHTEEARSLVAYFTLGIEGNPTIGPHGGILLKIPSFYRTIGFLSILFTGFIWYMMRDVPVKTNMDMFWSALIYLFFLGTGMYLIFAQKTSVEVEEGKITRYGGKGASKEITWTEIQSLTYNKTSRRLCLSNGKKKLYIDIDADGFCFFIKKCQKRSIFSIYSGALKSIKDQFDKIITDDDYTNE